MENKNQTKKYTVYEIEKITNNKFSKYKLNQAIENGELKAEKVGGGKKGRGIPKYFIYESDLKDYFASIEEIEKKKNNLLDEFENINSKIKKNTNIILRDYNEENSVSEIDDLKKKISNLEKNILILANNNEKNREKINEIEKKENDRRNIIMELANLGVFSIQKKDVLLEKLNKLA